MYVVHVCLYVCMYGGRHAKCKNRFETESITPSTVFRRLLEVGLCLVKLNDLLPCLSQVGSILPRRLLTQRRGKLPSLGFPVVNPVWPFEEHPHHMYSTLLGRKGAQATS